MPVTARALTSGRTATNATNYSTESVTLTGGRLTLVAISHQSVTAGQNAVPTSVTVAGHAFTLVNSQVISGQFLGTSLWRGVLPSGLATGVGAIVFANTQEQVQWSVVEFPYALSSGANGADGIVQSAVNQVASATTLTVTLAAFAATRNGAYAVFGWEGGVTVPETGSPDSGWTELHEPSTSESGFSSALQVQFRATNDTTATVTWTGAATNLTGIAVELAEAPAFATGTGPRRRQQPGAFPVGSWHRLGVAGGATFATAAGASQGASQSSSPVNATAAIAATSQAAEPAAAAVNAIAAVAAASQAAEPAAGAVNATTTSAGASQAAEPAAAVANALAQAAGSSQAAEPAAAPVNATAAVTGASQAAEPAAAPVNATAAVAGASQASEPAAAPVNAIAAVAGASQAPEQAVAVTDAGVTITADGASQAPGQAAAAVNATAAVDGASQAPEQSTAAPSITISAAGASQAPGQSYAAPAEDESDGTTGGGSFQFTRGARRVTALFPSGAPAREEEPALAELPHNEEVTTALAQRAEEAALAPSATKRTLPGRRALRDITKQAEQRAAQMRAEAALVDIDQTIESLQNVADAAEEEEAIALLLLMMD